MDLSYFLKLHVNLFTFINISLKINLKRRFIGKMKLAKIGFNISIWEIASVQEYLSAS